MIIYIKIIEDLIEKEELKGIETHTARLIIIAKMGLILNIVEFDLRGMTTSFENNLIASLNGWRTPITPTLLGPLRSCEYPSTFRSRRVIKATLTNTGIMVKTKDVIEVIRRWIVHREDKILYLS